MTKRPQHFLESLLSKPIESNSRNNKDKLSRLASYLSRETATRNRCGGYYPPSIFPPILRSLLFAPSSETRLLRGEGRGFSLSGKKGGVTSGMRGRLIPRLSSQLFALFAPADRIDGTNATRLKASCANFYLVLVFLLHFFVHWKTKSLRYQS